MDISDLVELIEHWGTNETLCDIGPMPWGDGVVDVADLEVLMSLLAAGSAPRKPDRVLEAG